MTYMLDSCAVIAMCNNEPGSDMVKRLFEEAERGDSELSMSMVQLLEVYYDRVYAVGAEAAKERVGMIIAGPVSIIDYISYPVMYEAGRLKTAYTCSLADAIACATALSLQATLVTSDHKELKAVEAGENLSFLWLPPRPRK